MKRLLKRIVPKPLWEYIRAHRYRWQDLVYNFGSRDCVTSYAGYTLHHSPGMAIVQRVQDGVFEKDLSNAMCQDLSRASSKVFFDVGANIGLVSLYIAAHVPEAQIYAFEPGPHQVTLLQKTIQHNQLTDRVILTPVALSESSGTATFYTHTDTEVAKDGFQDTGRASEGHAINVRTETLDEWWELNGQPKVSVIKIDTEGAELLVLKGAKKVLQSVKPIIYLEIDDRNLVHYPYTASDIVQYLQAYQYILYTLSGKEVGPDDIRALLADHDTFCARPIL